MKNKLLSTAYYNLDFSDKQEIEKAGGILDIITDTEDREKFCDVNGYNSGYFNELVEDCNVNYKSELKRVIENTEITKELILTPLFVLKLNSMWTLEQIKEIEKIVSSFSVEEKKLLWTLNDWKWGHDYNIPGNGFDAHMAYWHRANDSQYLNNKSAIVWVKCSKCGRQFQECGSDVCEVCHPYNKELKKNILMRY